MRRQLIVYLIIITIVSAKAGFIRSGSSSWINFGQNSDLGLANADMWVPEAAPERPKRRDYFSWYDKNGDGAVSFGEIEEFFDNGGRTENITAFDNDADGDLDREEFDNWHKSGIVSNSETSTQGR